MESRRILRLSGDSIIEIDAALDFCSDLNYFTQDGIEQRDF